MSEITETVISRHQSEADSVAPNGSARSHDYYTTVVIRQDWANVPENGIYAGRSYRIVERYISNRPDTPGQYIGRSSSPWEG